MSQFADNPFYINDIDAQRVFNWGGVLPTVTDATLLTTYDPRKFESVARWESPNGLPIPLQVAVQRNSTVERTAAQDAYTDAPAANITWNVGGANYKADIDCAPGNALSIIANTAEISIQRARNDNGRGLYSGSIAPCPWKSTATKTLKVANPTNTQDFPVPPFAKRVQIYRRSIFGGALQVHLVDHALNVIGEYYWPVNQPGYSIMLSADVRFIRNLVAGFTYMSMVFEVAV